MAIDQTQTNLAELFGVTVLIVENDSGDGKTRYFYLVKG